jgi:hypothetical protein
VVIDGLSLPPKLRIVFGGLRLGAKNNGGHKKNVAVSRCVCPRI